MRSCTVIPVTGDFDLCALHAVSARAENCLCKNKYLILTRNLLGSRLLKKNCGHKNVLMLNKVVAYTKRSSKDFSFRTFIQMDSE